MTVVERIGQVINCNQHLAGEKLQLMRHYVEVVADCHPRHNGHEKRGTVHPYDELYGHIAHLMV